VEEREYGVKRIIDNEDVDKNEKEEKYMIKYI
jgi:hypothetical protein